MPASSKSGICRRLSSILFVALWRALKDPPIEERTRFLKRLLF
jgi:hypothetical protein